MIRRHRGLGRVGATALAAALAVGALLGPAALPASAHGGGGAISLVNIEPTGTDTVALEVCVTFTLDRDQADTARVTVRAQGPEDAEVPAARMEVGDQPGLRTAEVEFPSRGSWTILVESTFPPAQLSVPVTVGGDVRASPAATALDPNQPAASCQPPSGDTPAWLVAGLGSALAIAVFGGLLLLLRRATTAPTDPS